MIMAQTLLSWGTLVYIMTVIAVGVAVSSIEEPSSCIKHRLKVNLKNKFYVNGEKLPIKIESSYRPSHQISSQILKILLNEVLGYENVSVTNTFNSMNQSEILKRIGHCSENSCDIAASNIPDTMVNLEVWSQTRIPHKSNPSWPNIAFAGLLGPEGHFGWFIPASIVKTNWKNNNLIIDHWRAFKIDMVTSQFSLINHSNLIQSMLYQDTANSNCDNCDNRSLVFNAVNDNCSILDGKCATLLSSYPGYDGGIIEEQINSLGLDVSATWIGSNLSYFVHERTKKQLPTLFYSWTPNLLTDFGNYSRIHFPDCETENYNQNSKQRACELPKRQFLKIAWSKLASNAPAAYHIIKSMHFSQEQYKGLLKLHIDRMEKLNLDVYKTINNVEQFEQTACQWINDNTAEWVKWLPNISPKKKKIYIGAMFPLTGPYRRLPGIVPGAELAIEHINADPRYLNDFQVELLVRDTQCKTDIAMAEFMHLIANSTHPIAGILGPGCAEVAENIAGVSKHFNKIVVSYSAEGLHLDQRSSYPFFFRTIPPITQNGEVLVKFFQRFSWEQVVLMAEDGKFSEYHQYLEKLFTQNQIHTVLQRNLPRPSAEQDAEKYLNEVLATGSKIIILTSFEATARVLLCEAYKKGMTRKQGYVWFLPHWFTLNWWNIDFFNKHYGESVTCTIQELLQAQDGHFTLSSSIFAEDEDALTVGGITVKQWRDLYEKRLETSDYLTEYASYTYDSVWVFALAFDKLLQEYPNALESLTADSVASRLLYHMNQTDFMGVSGQVHFSSSDRTGVIHIDQKQGNESVPVGSYYHTKDHQQETEMNMVLYNIKWYNGKVPSDSTEDDLICVIETLRSILDVSCDMAIVIINIVAVIILAIFIIILIIIIKIRYDKKVKVTRKRMEELGLMQNSNILSLDEWEISREHVVLNRKLGEGAFGTVYGGEAKVDTASEDEPSWVAVAVKTLKIGSNSDEKMDFLTEADMMKRFRHNNIVELLGVCTKSEPAYTIMEFMLYGDLKTFLLDRRHLVGQTTNEADDVSPKMLTKYSLDIASGLQYLATLKYVHRDVACRNCLVHVNKTVKISDFGMTRHIFVSDYYRFNRKGMLPVRWMAPESLMDGLFRHSSDIWAYGIVLYEIMTFGSFPYQGLSNTQVLDFIRDGNTLALPQAANAQLKGLISSCWNFEPSDRKTAQEIVSILHQHPVLVNPCLEQPQTTTTTSLNSLPYTYQDFRTFQLKLKKRPSAISSQLKMFNSLDKLPTIKRSVSRLTLVADDPSVFYWTKNEIESAEPVKEGSNKTMTSNNEPTSILVFEMSESPYSTLLQNDDHDSVVIETRTTEI